MSTTEKILGIQGERRRLQDGDPPHPTQYGISEEERIRIFSDLVDIDNKYEFFGTSALKAADIAFASLDILRKIRQPNMIPVDSLDITIPRPIRFHRNSTGHAGFRYIVDEFYARSEGMVVQAGMEIDEAQMSIVSIIQIATLGNRSLVEASHPYNMGFWIIDPELQQEHVMYMFANGDGDFRSFD